MAEYIRRKSIFLSFGCIFGTKRVFPKIHVKPYSQKKNIKNDCGPDWKMALTMVEVPASAVGMLR